MNWHLYAGFLLVTLLLGFTPGPNVALIVVNSATYGVRHGLVTVLGAFGGLVLQVLAVVCGLAALLAGLGHWFALLRWLGVGYLLWLGIRQWRAPSADLSRVRAEPPGRRHMLRQAFLVSCANPKIMLFLGALFPQFISATHPAQPQVVVLGATFLIVLGTIDSVWALLASRARRLLSGRGKLRQRLSGGILIAAAGCLAVAAHRR
jgi:homoserine/homoserine lactone efflux protein